MGFDLYGENPVMREINEDKYPVYNKYAGLTFNEREEIFKELKEDLEDKYWDEYRLRETENPGIYFRSNVWWWRRMWCFCESYCKDILTEKDIEHGHYNDMHLISEEKASAMAKRLQEKIDDGTAAHYENETKLAYEQCEKDKNGSPVDFDMNYPFAVNVLQEFILFCSESGGFTIG